MRGHLTRDPLPVPTPLPVISTQDHSCPSLPRPSGGQWPAASTTTRCSRFRSSTIAKSSATSKHGVGAGGGAEGLGAGLAPRAALSFGFKRRPAPVTCPGVDLQRPSYLLPPVILEVPQPSQALSAKHTPLSSFSPQSHRSFLSPFLNLPFTAGWTTVTH